MDTPIDKELVRQAIRILELALTAGPEQSYKSSEPPKQEAPKSDGASQSPNRETLLRRLSPRMQEIVRILNEFPFEQYKKHADILHQRMPEVKTTWKGIQSAVRDLKADPELWVLLPRNKQPNKT